MEDEINRYDIFDTTGTDHWRLMDGVAGDAVEIAHAVAVQTVSELTGLTVRWIEDHGGGDPDGELDVTCVGTDGLQDLFIRRTHDS